MSQVACILSFSSGFLSLFPHLFFHEPLPGPCLKKGGGKGEGGKHTPKPISRKKKNPDCRWTRWSRGAGAQGRSRVSARREEQAVRRARGRGVPPTAPLPHRVLPSPPGALPPPPPAPLQHWLAVSVRPETGGTSFPGCAFLVPLSVSPGGLAGAPREGGAGSALNACVFGWGASRWVPGTWQGQLTSACSLATPGYNGQLSEDL